MARSIQCLLTVLYRFASVSFFILFTLLLKIATPISQYIRRFAYVNNYN